MWNEKPPTQRYDWEAMRKKSCNMEPETPFLLLQCQQLLPLRFLVTMKALNHIPPISTPEESLLENLSV